ncbi:MAG: SDR family NAD(P)-dependent oxidoreductase [Myxococcota bacterium]|jgi:NAD(P)-dependent dehydrogenase (short-subunit alcohol dehydrogenase family)|nr:SDR family NAD(P)-dependent oxidoreductase [Myxococcota bacterium]
MQEFYGRVAVVTGAASGIGAGLARTFAAEGMKVVVSDIEGDKAERVSAELREQGVESIAVQTDVGDRAAVEALADETFRSFGGAHLVCNNAGVCLGASAHESTDADWEWLFRVNVHGVIHGCQAFIPRMIEQGEGGHIVNTASIGGLLPAGPILGVYTATKAAVVGISESYANSIEPHGIGLSILCPAFVATDLINAERNRPADLGTRAGELEDILGGGFEDGMTPETLGQWVLRAVREERRFIFSHPDMRPAVQDHFDQILADFDWAEKQSL